ncbi:hypothetical protein ARMSODRAFT_954596 [Armillaria solidipes]|uniref:Secreted protein n=1 Tax=Armillaria solidipes TaxID=1076256 RepID=A0A2H3BLK2_9AGAR|nr:hypothetical protein ARMSODRAFT_954596 [Armillaria solidipes]
MDWMFRWSFLCGVTTFVAQTSQSLQVSTSLRFELINVQRAAANGSFVNDIPSSDLTPLPILIQRHPTLILGKRSLVHQSIIQPHIRTVCCPEF